MYEILKGDIPLETRIIADLCLGGDGLRITLPIIGEVYNLCGMARSEVGLGTGAEVIVISFGEI